MGQTLTNGIYLPDEGEVRCYAGLASNWTTLDAVVGGYNAHVANENIHITSAERSKWNNGVSQAYVLRYASVSLTALGTVAFSALDNTYNIKIGDKVLDSEGKLFTLTAVDTANSTATLSALLIDLSKDSDLSNYYTKGETDTLLNDKADASALTAHTGDTTIHVTAADKEAWNGKADASALTAHTGNTTIHVTAEDKNKWDAVTGKADDTDVVHTSGAETIAGPKTFNSNTSIYNSDNSAVTPNLYLRSSKIEIAAQGNTSGDQNLAYADKNNTVYAYVKGAIQSNGSAVKIRAFCKDNSDNSIINEIQILANINGRKIIFPSNTNETELGTSSYKWKDINTVLINGINPGALFLPQDRSVRVDISAYFTNTASGATNRVTSPEDGYIFLTLTDVVIVHCFSQNESNLTHFGQTFSRPATGQLYCLFSVRKSDNVAVQWYTNAAAVTVSNAFFIPCKGNI